MILSLKIRKRNVLSGGCSMVDIYYYQFEGGAYDALKSSLEIDGVGFEPTRHIDEKTNVLKYYKCPAWSHLTKREFTVYAPRDLTLEFDYVNQSINSPNLVGLFDRFVLPIKDWHIHPTMQLFIPKIMMWTKAKNIWVEQKDTGLTALHNNFNLISGRWNLSQWERPLSFAVDIVDRDKPLIIKRGDPIYRVAFYQENNLMQEYRLVKSKPTQERIDMGEKRVNLKNLIPHLSKTLMFGDRPQCPIKFLQ